MENKESSTPPRMTYRKLEAWILSRQVAIDVFELTATEPLRRYFGLCDQMQRSAVSVPSNIAEGEERGSNKDALRFLYIAKGSLAELRTQIDIAHATGKVADATFQLIDARLDRVGRLLGGLVKLRRSLEP
jgi:four helix bundle protein